jgi:hypothetical protein
LPNPRSMRNSRRAEDVSVLRYSAPMRIHIRGLAALTLVAVTALLSVTLGAQKTDDAARIKNRAQLANFLNKAESQTRMHFVQGTENTFNYSTVLTSGLTTADSFEIVIGVTDADTIFLNAFPKYKGAYINIDKAKDPAALARQLLRLTARTFLHWGVDSSGDVFCGFTFTLESGFPSEAMTIVLQSVANHDQYITEIKPLLD